MRYLLHGFGQFHAEHQIGPNTWPHFDLLWIYSGRVTVQIGCDKPIELQGGDGALIFPHTPFQGKTLTRTSFASAQHFDLGTTKNLPPALRRLRRKKSGCQIYRGFSHSPVTQDIERAIHLATEPKSAATRELRQLNLAMILNQLEATPPSGPVAQQGRERLMSWRREFRKEPLLKATVAELALRVRMPSPKLRTFLAQHNTTPRRFLLEIRMEHARTLLTGSQLPIKAIAVETGYTDVVAFHRAFVGYFSETPAVYRERHAKLFTG